MTQYDPGVIQHFADKLYHKARRIVAARTLLGIVVGLVAGFVAGSMLHMPFAVLLGPFLFGVFGYQSGVERSFVLVLQAQSALCQMMIEANTRAAAQGAVKQTPPELPRVAA